MSDGTGLCYGCFEAQAGPGACDACGWEPGSAHGLTLSPGTLLHGRYVVGRVLGRLGGFGITYLGWHNDLQTRVAIKEFLPRDLIARADELGSVVGHSEDDAELFRHGLESFLQEARTLARLRHPNVARVTDYFEANGTAYLVMAYYEGQTLAERVAAHGTWRPDDAVRLVLQLLDGLRAVHEAGFLHRDIKPQNVYLTREGTPILLDFGAARAAIGERSAGMSVVLTPGFAPFEQYHRRGQQGPAADVYACGATLYYMISGEVPPEAPDRVTEDTLVPLGDLVVGVPAHVDRAVTRALALRAADRPQTVDEWRGMLRPPRVGAAVSPPVPAGAGEAARPRPAAPGPRRNPWPWVALAVVVLAVAGPPVSRAMRRNDAQPDTGSTASQAPAALEPDTGPLPPSGSSTVDDPATSWDERWGPSPDEINASLRRSDSLRAYMDSVAAEALDRFQIEGSPPAMPKFDPRQPFPEPAAPDTTSQVQDTTHVG